MKTTTSGLEILIVLDHSLAKDKIELEKTSADFTLKIFILERQKIILNLKLIKSGLEVGKKHRQIKAATLGLRLVAKFSKLRANCTSSRLCWKDPFPIPAIFFKIATVGSVPNMIV